MTRRPHADMKIRLPLSLREKIKAAASANNRSMNAEFIAMVEHGMQARSLEMVVAQALNQMLPVKPWHEIIGDGSTLYRSGVIDARPPNPLKQQTESNAV